MDNLSTSGRAGSGLREAAAEWFRNNQKTVRAPGGVTLEMSTVRRGGLTMLAVSRCARRHSSEGPSSGAF